MSIRKRKTSGGQSAEYHYEFMHAGKRYYGVCEGCTTERAALAYEKKIRDTVKTAAEQKSVKALIDNFREELTGGEAVSLAGAFDRYITKPKKRIPSEHQARTNRTYWNDFGFFCTLCKKWKWNIRNPCAVKSQSGIIGRDAPFYSV